MARRLRLRGVTLVEMTMTAAVVAILATSALPGLHLLLAKRALGARADQIAADLRFLRSAAQARNEMLRLSVRSGAAGSCYVLHSGPARACDCLAPEGAQCSAGAVALKQVFLPADGLLRVESNVPGMTFDPVHGTSSPAGWVQVADRRGHAIRHVVSALGRVRSCTLDVPAAAGYSPC